MNFDEYQDKTQEFVIYKDRHVGDVQVYPGFALAEEVGEFCGVLAKAVRDRDGNLSESDREKAEKELGDVLFQLARNATHYGFKLSKIADVNMLKLTDRKIRGVIKGSGDDR